MTAIIITAIVTAILSHGYWIIKHVKRERRIIAEAEEARLWRTEFRTLT